MDEGHRLLTALLACPPGNAGWRDFETTATDLLIHLFVPPLRPPWIQHRSMNGIFRRDAIFANRNLSGGSSWALLFHDLRARGVLVEYKNYDAEEIGAEEVNQVLNYMTERMGKLALMVCNKLPDAGAHQRRSNLYLVEQKMILFLLPDHLIEMVDIKRRGEDPADLLVDMCEAVYFGQD